MAANIRKGVCIHFHNDYYKIIDFLHVKTGRGTAFVRTKLKSLTNKRILEKTFTAGHKIEEIYIESRNYQFLYEERRVFHFMNTEDYNQIHIPKELIEQARFIKEGLEVTIIFKKEDETPINVKIPSVVTLKVTYTAPGIKGDTVTNFLKPATLETGAIIQVPLFICIGEHVLVNTEDGTYIGRKK